MPLVDVAECSSSYVSLYNLEGSPQRRSVLSAVELADMAKVKFSVERV